ncbi:MAG: acylneuraminate cytidylyltransferase family protein [Candidatus Omnitrophica bacterium]|nr:acylneuraminate cytidylyltransferase family protein [Candidatus Omnitrophota bacterium]
MADILVIIGARGGSKGVKDKNIRPLGGKPLIAYTIEQALRWGKAKRVVVSTDSEEIAKVAEQFGAHVPFMRPPELATDTASKGDVINHALVTSEKKFHEQYDIVVDFDVTAPIRTTQDMDNCLEMFLKRRPDTLFSVVKAHKSPYFNMVERTSDGNVVLCKALETEIFRRQDSPQVYSLNASIYFYDREYLLRTEHPSPLSGHAAIYEMDDISGIDIDREIDFKFIEFLLKEKVVNL